MNGASFVLPSHSVISSSGCGAANGDQRRGRTRAAETGWLPYGWAAADRPRGRTRKIGRRVRGAGSLKMGFLVSGGLR